MWKVCSDPSGGVGNREKLFEKQLVIFINKYKNMLTLISNPNKINFISDK